MMRFVGKLPPRWDLDAKVTLDVQPEREGASAEELPTEGRPVDDYERDILPHRD